MARYFIKISYCGTAYNGWQSQPHIGTKTVQSTLESALSLFLRQPIDLTGCGRTDTGVHAKDYYAHFDSQPLSDISTIIHRINKILPKDIVVYDIKLMHDQAHSRFDALSRSYEYHIHTSKSPFDPMSFYYTYDKPDINILNEAAKILLNYTDFTTFCKLNSDVKTMNCRITECFWILDGANYTFRISADRFLRGMIRLIVGMCLNVARNKYSLEEVKNALNSNQRLTHDWSVPACGLFLCDIRYPYLD